MSEPLKIIFAGTPHFAAAHLQALLNNKHHICAVLTQPDKASGRGKIIQSSPVKQLAQKHQIPVYQPASLRTPDIETTLKNLAPDVLIVVAYGLILPKNILNIPRYGCINVHASLLPRWRGAAPIQYAILSGDNTTGITIMQMDEGMDTGDILLQKQCPIHTTDTSETLSTRLIKLGQSALLESLDLLSARQLTSTPQQDNLATYTAKITKQDAELDWSQPAIELDQKIRAFIPRPVCYATFVNTPIRIWESTPLDTPHQATPGTVLSITPEGLDMATGKGILRITKLQFPDKKALPIQDIFNSKKAWFESL